MRNLASRSSSTLFLLGGLAIVFGVIAAIWPLSTAVALVMLWGAYALVDGIGSFVAASGQGLRGANRALFVVGGIVGVLAGFIALFRPISSAVALAWVLGIWLVVRGVLEIVAAFGHVEARPRWLVVVGGVLWIVAGILFVANPGAAALTVSLWLGVLAVLWGVLLIGAGLAVRGAARSRGEADQPA